MCNAEIKEDKLSDGRDSVSDSDSKIITIKMQKMPKDYRKTNSSYKPI